GADPGRAASAWRSWCHLLLCKDLSSRFEEGRGDVHEIADPVERQIRRGATGEMFGARGVVPLVYKNRGEPAAPRLLHRSQNPGLVVHHHVAFRGKSLRDAVEGLFLVDEDEDPSFHRVPEARALDLAGLEYHVPIRKDHRAAEAAEVIDHLEGIGVEAIGEGI